MSSSLPATDQRSSTCQDFIAAAKLESYLDSDSSTAAQVVAPDVGQIREILAKSLKKEPLELAETAVLLKADAPELVETIFDTARQLKRDVYGNRIVLFAPIYVGNLCANDCRYCGFRSSNPDAVRRTLTAPELQSEAAELLKMGHKRTILVFGEHRNYNAEYIAECVKSVYDVSLPNSNANIRRININAAPFDAEGFKTVKAAGIGTYQIFQETYHQPTYGEMHPPNTRKGDYLWRLDSHSRALEAGVEDVGIGVLFGLADWKFDTLGLVAHARHLMKEYKIGPHTISFPRVRPASGLVIDDVCKHDLTDYDFLRMVSILRLSVPYTGLIMTAREPAEVRRVGLSFGVSQIDAATRIEIGGYSQRGKEQDIHREQFSIGDVRSLDAIVTELLETGYVPSFCTACYRVGRTGEVFMEYAIPGFIQKLCTPNALTTLEEYLVDFASPQVRELGEKVIEREISTIDDETLRSQTRQRLEKIKTTRDRDVFV